MGDDVRFAQYATAAADAAPSPLCVDVVIVAHDSGGLLAEAAASAAEQVGVDHVWVVDAESSDGSMAALRRRRPSVHILSAPNAGFAASNNRGIAATSAPFVLLLNPDAVLLPGALESLLETATARPSAAVVAPLVLNFDGTVQANSFGRFPTLRTAVALRAWRALQLILGNRALSPAAPRETVAADWVTGAAMLVRRAAIDAVGGLDGGFFLYYEDVEWCHRMRDAGWEVVVEPRARVAHQLGCSAAPGGAVEKAYRASFLRYCDLYGLWALKAVARLAVALRRFGGGRA
jgi:N-acetylglucosaminyl-diphospho-decaprenol L-rhamnosyltransferase